MVQQVYGECEIAVQSLFISPEKKDGKYFNDSVTGFRKLLQILVFAYILFYMKVNLRAITQPQIIK
jgi:hypothetical protein